MALKTYDLPEDLYRARGDEVNAYRPVYTGDVFRNVAIAEVQVEGLGILLSQACTMRQPDGTLKSVLWAAPVIQLDLIGPTAWSKPGREIRRSPLPDLFEDGTFCVVDLPNMGMTRTADLQRAERQACLSEFGVNLLQQRMVQNMTRAELTFELITEATTANFNECDLEEDFCDALCSAGLMNLPAASVSFNTFMSERLASGQPRRNDLRTAAKRSAMRRACTAHAEQLIAAARS